MLREIQSKERMLTGPKGKESHKDPHKTIEWVKCRLVDENGQIGQRVIADLWTDALKPKQAGGGRTIYFTNYTCGHHTHETCWLWGGELGGGGRPETRSGQDCALHPCASASALASAGTSASAWALPCSPARHLGLGTACHAGPGTIISFKKDTFLNRIILLSVLQMYFESIENSFAE